MRSIRILCWIISSLFLTAQPFPAYGEAPYSEEGPLAEKENALLQLVREHADDIPTSNTVMRVFSDVTKTNLLYTEFVFIPQEGVIAGKYKHYRLIIPTTSQQLLYRYETVDAIQGDGTLHIAGKNLFRLETQCTTEGCSTLVSQNGNALYAGNTSDGDTSALPNSAPPVPQQTAQHAVVQNNLIRFSAPETLGAVMQCTSKNPLPDPYQLGVSYVSYTAGTGADVFLLLPQYADTTVSVHNMEFAPDGEQLLPSGEPLFTRTLNAHEAFVLYTTLPEDIPTLGICLDSRGTKNCWTPIPYGINDETLRPQGLMEAKLPHRILRGSTPHRQDMQEGFSPAY